MMREKSRILSKKIMRFCKNGKSTTEIEKRFEIDGNQASYLLNKMRDLKLLLSGQANHLVGRPRYYKTNPEAKL